MNKAPIKYIYNGNITTKTFPRTLNDAFPGKSAEYAASVESHRPHAANSLADGIILTTCSIALLMLTTILFLE